MKRILHFSDLHFGRTQPELVEGLVEAAIQANPDLVIVSGDFTQRARSHEFLEAAAFIKRMPAQVLAVPGNHDIPLYHLARRIIRPLSSYRRYIESQTKAVYEDPEIIVGGLNTVTRWRWKEGRLRSRQMVELRSRIRSAGNDKVKIAFMHHPPVGRLKDVAVVLGDRPDFILSGHLHHQGAEIHPSGAILVAAGTAISTRTRGLDNSFNLICVETKPTIQVDIHIQAWNGKQFVTAATQKFERTDEGKWKN